MHGAFCGAHSPWCLWSQAPRGVYSPQCFGFGLDAPHTPTGVSGCWVERRLKLMLQQNSPKCPQGSFFGGAGNLPAQSCGSLCTRKCLSSHTAHFSSYSRDCPGQGRTGPNSQLSPSSAHGLGGFTTSSLFPSLRIQATRSLMVLCRPCLSGEGAINLALSQESCSRPGSQAWGCSRPGPRAGPRDLLS